MRDRLRNFDSKITFFAFADIITAVSGMLIFITLLLATDLGRPTDNRSQAANAELERRLQETLAQQAAADAKNRGLQNILATANTAPSPDKLEADISHLRTELAEEKTKHAGLAEQLAASKSTLEERDKLLGITAVKARIEDSADELAALAREEAKVHDETAALENQITNVRSKIVKLRSREGQIWLIPDRSSNTKEPVLVIVSGSEARIERFNKPDETQKFDKSHARDNFGTFLKKSNPAHQYFVFLIRPSGIGMFKELVGVARDASFEVGFDALEENKEIHFTAPPPIDDEATTTKRSESSTSPKSGRAGSAGGPRTSGASGTDTSDESGAVGATATGASTNGTSSQTNGTGSVTNSSTSVTNASPSSTNTNTPPPSPPPPKPKSWWQRFLEWIGIS